VVDWQEFFAKEVVPDQLVAAESGREYSTTGANIVAGACCLDHP